jgi:hypothetical protein
MAIQSVDNIVSSISAGKTAIQPYNKITGAAAYTAGRWYNTFTLGGTPVAGSYSGTALNAVQMTDATTGSIYHGGNVSTDIKHLLNTELVTSAATGVPAFLMLVDFLMYYPTISMNSATAQTLVNGVSLPRYTDGNGVRAFLEITATSGATAHNVALTYTDQAGNTGNALGATTACTASAIVPHITHSGTAANNYGPFLPLAAGDTGIRSAQSITISAASGAGTAALVLCKPLATIPLSTVSVATGRDFLFNMPSLPQIVDGACLGYLLYSGAATAASTTFMGTNQFVWG